MRSSNQEHAATIARLTADLATANMRVNELGRESLQLQQAINGGVLPMLPLCDVLAMAQTNHHAHEEVKAANERTWQTEELLKAAQQARATLRQQVEEVAVAKIEFDAHKLDDDTFAWGQRFARLAAAEMNLCALAADATDPPADPLEDGKKGRRRCVKCKRMTAWNNHAPCVSCRLRAAADKLRERGTRTAT